MYTPVVYLGIMAFTLYIYDAPNKLFKDNKKVIDRVHWAPVFITNNVIRETFGDYAEVKSVKHEVYTDAGLDGIATGVRKVLMVGDRHQVPHVLEVVDPDTAEVCKCLVTIAGRPPALSAVQKDWPRAEELHHTLLPPP